LKLKVLMVSVWPAKGFSSATAQNDRLAITSRVTSRVTNFFMIFLLSC